ncbi:MAG: AAA family ATPase [bacterium]|nr:AAA family ATPase [bacterium]
MRICTLRLDGYGCFTDRALDLCPGLQVMLGPNEQTTSTLCTFIGDVLYGQKSDPSHQPRPSQHPDHCAGAVRYRLDDGREFDVERTFGHATETFRVTDLASGRDITHEFQPLPNGEPAPAQAHLGFARQTFLDVAAFAPLALDELSGDDPLARITSHLVAVTQAPTGSAAPGDALGRLDAWLAAIGRGTPGNGDPHALSDLLTRIDGLTAEREQTRTRRESANDTDARLAAATGELARLRSRQGVLQGLLADNENASLLSRLREVDRLKAERDDLTQRCFSLSAYREFPLDQAPEVQRTANAAATARSQLERSERENDDLQRQADEERERLGDAAQCELVEVPDGTEERLRELEESIDRLHEHLEDLEGDRIAAEALHAKAQEILTGLPDFSQMGPDPVEWINQFATSFRLQADARDREQKSLARTSDEVQRLSGDVAPPERTFTRFENFPQAAQDHEQQARLYQEQWSALTTRVEKLQTAIADDTRAIPQCIALTLTGFCFMSALGAMAYFLNPYLYVAAALSGAMGVYHLAFWTFSRHSIKRRKTAIAGTEDERAALEKQHKAQRDAMEAVMRETGLETVRELEALYDRYIKGRDELDRLTKDREDQEKRYREEAAQADELLQKLRLTFTHLGVKVEGEADVAEAASRAIARYQEYRDAKRRVADTRERPTRIRARYTQTKAQLDALEREEVSLSLDVRNLMRKAGFRDESRHTSALGALRAYRIRVAQLRERRDRVATLDERLTTIQERMVAERDDLHDQEAALAAMLEASGATSFEVWQEQAEKAKDYQEFWKLRTDIGERIETLLGGQDLEDLRRAAAEAGPVPDCPGGDAAEIRIELEAVARAIEAAVEQERALKAACDAQQDGLRPLAEIDEALAEARALAGRLQRDVEAASYAASVIEEVAREERTSVAPELARLAGEYLAVMTRGAYTHVLLEDGLRIRLPDATPPLGPGVLNQVCLAIRLALVQWLGANGESVPNLLDDPFAHCDGDGLASSLGLLETLGNAGQVILLTCRHDVAEAAEARGIPILRL